MTAYLFNAAPICTTPSEGHRQIFRELPPRSKASEIINLFLNEFQRYFTCRVLVFLTVSGKREESDVVKPRLPFLIF